MATTAYLKPALDWRWLRSRPFDLFFIVGVVACGIAAGTASSLWPALFPAILVFDLWFLGYHHVISTYTRLCFDRESFRGTRPLLLVLLPAVALATAVVAWSVGLWAVISVYFYWQWFHYTRQSWGISRAYRGKDRDALYEDGWLDQAIFYALPVLGILYRSHQDPGTFLVFALRVVPVPAWLVAMAAVAAAALLAVWAARRLQAWQAGRLNAAHTLYMTSHFTIFLIAYVAIPDLTYGWLAINVWHNLQYILFVWLFNTRRFRDGVDPRARLLSYISQPGRLPLYLLVCLAVTWLVYQGVLTVVDQYFLAGLSATIVLYQIVNFHHYIVDSLIWKVRKPAIKDTLGLH